MLTPDHECACVDPNWVDLTTQLNRAQTKFGNATVEVDASQAKLLSLHGEWLENHGSLLALAFAWLAALSLIRRPR